MWEALIVIAVAGVLLLVLVSYVEKHSAGKRDKFSGRTV